MSTLEGMVKTLARRRAEYDVLEAAYKMAEERHAKAAQGLPTYRAKCEAEEAVADALEARMEADANLREAALGQFERDKDKHPTPGVNLKINKKYEIDMKEAAAWARTNAPGCFVLDKTKYQQVAVDLEGPITVVDVPVVLVDSDLSRLLDLEEG